MSAATTSSNVTHLPHTAHRLPLREQAFTLHCRGLRSPAIAHTLGIPERTIRAWIASALDDLKEDLQLNRRDQLLLAVERQHQLTAAWEQFARAAAARDALLDAVLAALHAAANAPSGASSHQVIIHLSASSLAQRYLSLILQANKEANRLYGLHARAKLLLITPDPDAASTECDIPAESATGSLRPTCANGGAQQAAPAGHEDDIPAESATAFAAKTATENPAESATAVAALGISAESATTARYGSAAGIQHAHPKATAPSPPGASIASAASNHSRPAKTATHVPAGSATTLDALSPACKPSVPASILQGRDSYTPTESAIGNRSHPASRHCVLSLACCVRCGESAL